MSIHKCGSATASENVTKRPCKSITIEEKMEVIRQMEGQQSCPTVCMDLNVVSPTVTTIMKMLIKLKRKWNLQEGSLLQLLHTHVIL